MRLVAVVAIAWAGCGGVAGQPSSSDRPPPLSDRASPLPSASPSPSTPPSPLPSNDPCAGAQYGDGAYCGGPLGGDADALYDCAGGRTAMKTACPLGCHTAPPGVADYCEDPSGYHLPWSCGATYPVTQGNHGDVCGGGTGDHTGVQEYAWDFGLPRHTGVRAARGGTVTVAANVVGPGQDCYDGCTQPFGTSAFWSCCNACINTSNHVNVQHDDGSVATYWHLDQVTVATGAHVEAGELVGYSGTSGCSSGPHLHFQVMGDCPTGYCQSIPTMFEEVGAPACGARVTSQNGC